MDQSLLLARALRVPLDYLADDDSPERPELVASELRRRIWELVELVGEDEALRRLAKADRHAGVSPVAGEAAQDQHLARTKRGKRA